MLKDVRADSIRGKQSEDNTRLVLKDLRNENRILSFRQTLKGSPDDRCGIDFYFAIKVKAKRIEIPLQVKSSRTGIQNHNQYGGLIHAVNGQSSDLREQIEAVINEYEKDLGGEPIMAVVKEEIKPTVILPNADHRVHVESNYNKFKFIPHLNRPLKASNVKNLMISFQEVDKSDYSPILVNNRNEIIDGQHRFTVWKQLGMPIKYKKLDYDGYDLIPIFNANQAAWSINDFIHNQAGVANINFSMLEEDTKKYGISPKVILSFILGIPKYNDRIRNKSLVYTATERNRLKKVMNAQQLFSRYSFGKQANFLKALSALVFHPSCDVAHLAYQASKYPAKLMPQTGWEGYLEDLVSLYNYHRPKGSHINIRDFE